MSEWELAGQTPRVSLQSLFQLVNFASIRALSHGALVKISPNLRDLNKVQHKECRKNLKNF